MKFRYIFLILVLVIGNPFIAKADVPGENQAGCEQSILDIVKYCFLDKPTFDPVSCGLSYSSAFVFCNKGVHPTLCSGLGILKDAYCKNPPIQPVCNDLTAIYSNNCII